MHARKGNVAAAGAGQRQSCCRDNRMPPDLNEHHVARAIFLGSRSEGLDTSALWGSVTRTVLRIEPSDFGAQKSGRSLTNLSKVVLASLLWGYGRYCLHRGFRISVPAQMQALWRTQPNKCNLVRSVLRKVYARKGESWKDNALDAQCDAVH